MLFFELDPFLYEVGEGPLMSIDPGKKRLGLAFCDQFRSVAVPIQVYARKNLKEDLQFLFTAAQQRDVVGWVLGDPLNLNGTVGPSAQSARSFAGKLVDYCQQPVLMWDERLTSSEAEKALIALDTSRAKRKKMIDAHAANYLLQTLCDRIQHLRQ